MTWGYDYVDVSVLGRASLGPAYLLAGPTMAFRVACYTKISFRGSCESVDAVFRENDFLLTGGAGVGFDLGAVTLVAEGLTIWDSRTSTTRRNTPPQSIGHPCCGSAWTSGHGEMAYPTPAYLTPVRSAISRFQDKAIPALKGHDFKGLVNLEYLSLGGNELAELPAAVFADLFDLAWLSLDYNQLTELQPTVFRGLANLRRLELRHNRISDLPDELFFGLGRLEELLLGHNEFKG